MSDTIGSVNVRLAADASALQAAVEAGAKSLQKLERVAVKTSKSAGQLVVLKGLELGVKGISATIHGITSLGTSLLHMGRNAAEAIDTQNALASRIGMTFSQVATFKYAAEQANTSFDAVVVASNKLDKALVGLQSGNKATVAAFDRLGLAAKDFAGQDAAARFVTVGNAIAGMKDSVDRSAAAMTIFGRGGAALLPLFNEGAGFIANMNREAKQLGLHLTNAQAGSVDKMLDSFHSLQTALAGITRQVTAALSPALNSAMQKFLGYVKKIGADKIGEKIASFMLDAVDALLGAVDTIMGVVADMQKRFDSTAKATLNIGTSLLAGPAGIGGLVGQGIGHAIMPGPEALKEGRVKLQDWFRGVRQDIEKQKITPDVKPSGLKLGKVAAEEIRSVIQDSVAQVTAISQNTAEGLAAKFRWLRGDTGNEIQEKQLDALNRIADGLDEEAIIAEIGA